MDKSEWWEVSNKNKRLCFKIELWYPDFDPVLNKDGDLIDVLYMQKKKKTICMKNKIVDTSPKIKNKLVKRCGL